MDSERFYEMALPYIKEVIKKDLDLKKISDMVKTRIEIFPDIKDHIDFFEEMPEYSTDLYIHKKMKTTKESSLEVLKEIRPVLADFNDYTNDSLYQLLVSFAEQKEIKNGMVLWPIRTALSGKPMTPCGATELLEVLGKEESLRRIDGAIEKLSNES
jgi:glutamyl-tRNA synthetase